jgi:hypothetical protein
MAYTLAPLLDLTVAKYGFLAIGLVAAYGSELIGVIAIVAITKILIGLKGIFYINVPFFILFLILGL